MVMYIALTSAATRQDELFAMFYISLVLFHLTRAVELVQAFFQTPVMAVFFTFISIDPLK